jgi:phosphoribosylformylglycinamidine cyclo-ligase
MSESPSPSAYAAAGVDLVAADDALERIREAVASTYTPGVLRGLGAFGGLFALPAGLVEPVLVASTDGVGTKTRLGVALGRVRGLGSDLVNHCINDILVQGARPLFFLDYVASARLEPTLIAEVVGGMADACRASGVALLGGETAEMPGVYAPGEIDLVGTIVGVVERGAIVDGSTVAAGDVLLALASGGLQTNGFSLARALAAGEEESPLDPDKDGGPTLGEALLAPHRSFEAALRPLLDAGLVRGLAHITGGGLPGNLPRTLPAGLGAEITLGSWSIPPVFTRLQALGGIEDDEMRRVFNLGVGMVVVVSAADVAQAQTLAPERLTPIGTVVAGAGVHFR